MITASFRMNGDRIEGFTVKGHSGYADEGHDIVCAAVTSAVRLTECAVNDVPGRGPTGKGGERAAAVTLRLPGGLGEENESTCQTLLTALMVYLTELHGEYPENIIVMEEE